MGETEEQAKHAALCKAVNEALIGAPYAEGLEALAAVAARLCVEGGYPQNERIAFIGEFLRYTDHEISEVETETVITIPEHN